MSACAYASRPSSRRESARYGEVERLVVVRDSDYDDIRAMLARSREAGFMALG